MSHQFKEVLTFVRSIMHKIQRFRNRRRLFLVNDSALEASLIKLGMWESLQKGETRCCYCREIVTLDNLQGWSRHQGQIYVFCNKTTCQLAPELERGQ